ncbi:MAG: PDDEXK nuclease domain-containing protein [Bacteroidales bacterium]|nr:PDDEXK nuclease domain-containing protein [Bacteroidales bacterium]
MANFYKLLKTIEGTDNFMKIKVAGAVNVGLTIRNWLIGLYIVEFELNGEDRAKYGEALIDELVKKLNHIKGVDRRSLYRFKDVYNKYSHIANTDYVKGVFNEMVAENIIQLNVHALFPQLFCEKVGTMSPQLENQKVVTLSPQFDNSQIVPAELIITRLSYSHIELLLSVEESLKRAFYETECIKGTWSVRQLKRQIDSLCFERMGLSKNPEHLLKKIREKSSDDNPLDVIKNIYSFDFLELNHLSIVEESDLETALINNIQDFILELGNGFCFEARQKRILIGKKYYFIDLVFYHRIIRCHVLIDLKIGEFDHESIGQLNTYLNYYKAEISEPSDNPPVGILLVAEKDNALVQFATAGMDQNLFVQKYLINLPDTKKLEDYIKGELKKLS